MFFKDNLIALVLNIVATIFKTIPLVPMLIMNSGVKDINPVFYWQHLIPMVLILIVSVSMCVISTREKYLIHRDYKVVLNKLYNKHHTDDTTEEEWEEFKANELDAENPTHLNQIINGNAYYDNGRVWYCATKDLSRTKLNNKEVENFHVYVWRTQGGETIRIGEEDDVVNKVSYEEPMSFSIINSKEMHVIFDKRNRDFIESDVLPYLKQVIPASTIFSYSFEIINGDNELEHNSKIHKTICEDDTCPVYSVYNEDNEE
jgi:hypothetical protein